MKHVDQVLNLLNIQIGNKEEVNEILATAEEVAQKWVAPLSGGKQEINGLIYGLVQSGKTGVLTTTGAKGADEGYKTIIILTSDNDALYEQTLDRVREAFPGVDIIAKQDFKDPVVFIQRVKVGITAIVTSKNSKHLNTLLQNFKGGRVKGLTCLIIDDEADQASLNTKESRGNNTKSPMNSLISNLRKYFEKNTYLQVTATPQALFLQTQSHDFRPKFTVLSHPGADYIGGDDFFGEDSKLVREFHINDISAITTGNQPSPNQNPPKSLINALDTFMIAATFKRIKAADQNCAFLCHVSTRKADHDHIVEVMRQYKTDLPEKLKAKNPAVLLRMKSAYEDLSSTHPELSAISLDDLLTKIIFFSPGINVKLVNGSTDEDVAVRSPYNLFVGGNKLGRGVTIKNLLVSYYGRNPKKPQADTVLQHARMYGYRRKDIGLLRLFLPPELNTVFKAIHKMERGLRDMIAKNPSEGFRGVYVEGNLNPTRKSVLAPGAIGIYSAGGSYNPSQVKRDSEVAGTTSKIDHSLKEIKDKSYNTASLSEISKLILECQPDQTSAEKIWDSEAIAASIKQLAEILQDNEGYIYVDRERGLKENRRETQGILDGGEARKIPSDKLTLFMLRTKDERGKNAAWWPQIRFPDGRYAFAFSI